MNLQYFTGRVVAIANSMDFPIERYSEKKNLI